ncbi:MAG: uncharacterized protein QOG04_997 [Actinomycetota bacterium]|nr:uncharacterized protein [Actinomycetota bacterium]
MKRALAVAIGTLLGVPLLAHAASTDVQLAIAKTDKRIYAYGTVTPPHAGQRVRIRFFYNDDTGYVLSAQTHDTLSAKGRYEVTFHRPTTGTCKVQTRFRSRSGKITKEEEIFECRIPEFSTGTASMTAADGVHNTDIEIANDGPERGYGLMYRRWLGANKGMAFLFGGEPTGSFYMENTLIPLSIAFFDSTNQIVSIMDMEPCEDPPEGGCPLYNPGTSYVGALEVNKGAFAGWGVTEGDFISISED